MKYLIVTKNGCFLTVRETINTETGEILTWGEKTFTPVTYYKNRAEAIKIRHQLVACNMNIFDYDNTAVVPAERALIEFLTTFSPIVRHAFTYTYCAGHHWSPMTMEINMQVCDMHYIEMMLKGVAHNMLAPREITITDSAARVIERWDEITKGVEK